MEEKMKKVISILLGCMLFAVNVSAADDVAYSVDETIEYLEDGSYFVTKTEKISDSTGIQLFSGMSTCSGKRTKTHKLPSGVKLWEVSVTGIFTYNGAKATCTKATVSAKSYSASWKVSNKSASKSGNKAKAKAQATGTVYRDSKAYAQYTETTTLTCSKNGKLS